MKKFNIYKITTIVLILVLFVSCFEISSISTLYESLSIEDDAQLTDITLNAPITDFTEAFPDDEYGIISVSVKDEYPVEITTEEKKEEQESTKKEEVVTTQKEETKEEIKEAITTTEVETSKTKTYKYSEDDIYLLARIVMAEVEGETQRCKELVAQVVLNRVEGKNEFPNTVYGVIFQKNQFSPTANGRWERVQPNQDCYDAVYTVLNATEPITPALYFESCSGESWHSRNLTMVD